MASYDGSDFIGIDGDAMESAIDPGPVDTGLRRRIAANIEYLLGGRDSVACTFQGGDSTPGHGEPYYNDRPWASVDWSCPIIVPLWIEAGDVGARISVYFSTISNSTEPFSFRACVTDGTLRRVLGQSVTSENSGTWLSFEEQWHIDFDVEFSAPYSGRAHYGSIQLWIKSGLNADIDRVISTPSQTPTTYVLRANSGTAAIGLQPTYGEDGVAYLQTENDAITDIIGVFAKDGAESFLLDRRWSSLLAGSGTSLIDLKALTYVQARSATITKLREPWSVTPQTPANLGPGLPELGLTAARQAERARFAYDHRRMLCWGPPGYHPPNMGETQAVGMPLRWRTIRANSTDQGAICFDDSVMIRRENPTIEIVLYVMSFIHIGQFYGSDGGSANWQFSASIETLDTASAGTDWATAGVDVITLDQTENIPTINTNGAYFGGPHPRIKIQRAFLRNGILGQLGQLTSDWPYAFKDGQLFAEDVPLIVPIYINLDLNGLLDVADLSKPYRVRVSAEYVDDTLEGGSGGPYSGSDLQYGLELTTVGYSVWQRGPEL